MVLPDTRVLLWLVSGSIGSLGDCRPPGPSRRQLLDVSWGSLQNLCAHLSAGRVNDRNGVAVLVVTYAARVRPFLPDGAIGVVFELPCPVHDRAGCRLIELSAV